MSIRILCLGEVVGKSGTTAIKQKLAALKAEKQIDYVIANGEGVSNGFGITKAHAILLQKSGIDLITGGEKVFYKKDMVEFISKCGFLLRPINYPPAAPGKGIKNVTVKDRRLCIINILGNSDFPKTHLNNAFLTMNSLADKISEETDATIVIFHASTTAEKNTMGYLLDGRVAAVIGTHSKVLTNDARILPKGTAYITDIGRCGSATSVGGFQPDVEIEKFMTQIPKRSINSELDLQLQGVIITLEDDNRASSIEMIRI